MPDDPPTTRQTTSALTFGWCMLLLTGILAQALAGAQSAGGALSVSISRIDTPRFPQVTCYVSVLDAKHRSITGLTSENLTLSEDDTPISSVEMTSILPGKERIAVMLVLDRSGSMSGRSLSAAVTAAEAFAGQLNQNDALGLATFSSVIDTPVEATTERAALRRALQSLSAAGETALYDAIAGAIHTLTSSAADRKAIVVLTDGFDNASAATLDACSRAGQQAGIAVYTIALGNAVHLQALQRLANETGGMSFQTHDPDDLTQLYRAIAVNLHNQYLVRYTSPASASKPWHIVAIRVDDHGASGSARYQYLAASFRENNSPSATGATAWLLPSLCAALILVNLGLIGALVIRKRRSTEQSQ